MKYILFATALVIALSGCTTVSKVDVAPTRNDCKIVRPVDLADSQVRYQVTLTDGRQVEATRLHEASGSFSWVDPDTGTGYAVPRSHVEALTYTEAGVRYCVALGRIASDPSRVGSFLEINTQAQRQKARVVLVNGASLTVSSLQVTSDSTSWKDSQTGHFETVATDEIDEITFVDLRASAGIGLLTGAALGALLGYGATCGEDGCLFSRTDLAVGFGGLGGLLGVFVGAATGLRDTYRFDVPAPAPEVAAGEGLVTQRGNQSILHKYELRRKP